ncbi:MAG: iron chelate uptake ABC transporter family permease subunit [Aggregatilineales bacterium]
MVLAHLYLSPGLETVIIVIETFDKSVASIAPPQKIQSATTSQINLQLRPILLPVLALLLLAVFLISLALGSVNIPFDQIIRVLLGGEADKASWTTIILKLRLPGALTAMMAGAALGVSGLMMQTFFRNPLAGPFVLGISSGASLGVAILVLATGSIGTVLLTGIGFTGDMMLAGAAATGSGITMLVVLLLARHIRSSMTLLILGLMMGYLVSAIVSLLLYFALPERIQAYINWTFGSFNGVTSSQLPILAGAVIPGLLIALALIKSLNALLPGEAIARSLGVNILPVRIAIVAATALLTGAVTAFCGPIGFIGIAVPHLCRSLFHTSDHRMLVPGTILMGAILALIAAIIAEVPGSNIILPLNAVTALIGAPILIAVILRQRNLRKSFAA